MTPDQAAAFDKWVGEHDIQEDYNAEAIALARAAFEYAIYQFGADDRDLRVVLEVLKETAETLYRHLERPRQSVTLRKAKDMIAQIQSRYALDPHQ